ncbi:hypothetical protein [Actinoplanes philippinensis]|uniref:hypothetical protein n=1 Tax=Actinoplanes philippinensis TaxID=35752 RepID=UPI0034055E57
MTHDAAEADARQELTNNLLAAAVSASHAVEVLSDAINSPAVETFPALSDLQTSFQILSDIRSELVRCADALTAPS